MCGRETQPSHSASLNPPQGDPLVLNEGVTWIGRGNFAASKGAQLLCSRRQACFKLTATGLVLECHGINPLLFVVCHSRNFYGTEETPATELFQLQKGEAVELTDGDKFYFAAMECLLTIVIRQNNVVTGPISRDAMDLPLQQASEAFVKEKELQDVEIPRGPAEDCGTNEPQRILLKEDRAMRANSSETVAPSQCPGAAGTQELLVAPMSMSNSGFHCWPPETRRDGSVRTEQEDSDSLGLDAYDCAAVEVRPCPREEIPDPAVAVENANSAEMNEPHEIRTVNCTEKAVTSSTVDKGLEEARCPHLSVDGEGFRPLNDRSEALPTEACANSGQRETQDYNAVMSSETADGRSMEDELLHSEPMRGLAFGNVGDRSSSYLNIDVCQADDAALSRSLVSRIKDECPRRMGEEEHPETSGRANEREDDPVTSADVEDESWPDGPVEGMERVIASVSGYEGVDKQNLVKMINKTGAAFTGVFSKANTHLVCRSFHGKKFDSAMRLRKAVVNHQWFEDCLRAGKRLSEGPYKLRSGEDVGPLKWKGTPPPPLTERAEPSNGAADQHLSDHGAFFWNTIDEEGNMNHQGQDSAFETTSYLRGLPGPSRQAGVGNIEAGHTRGRKSRRLIKRSGVEVDPVTVEQENLVRENPSSPASSSGRVQESYQRRTSEFVGDLDQGYNTRRRKSAISALYNVDQGQEHDVKCRKLASSVRGRGIDGQEQGGVSNLRDKLTGRGRSYSSVAPDREFTVINLADDADDDVREIGVRIPQAASAQATEGTNAESSRDRSLQDSQPSQSDRGVACVICLVEVKSPSEGLLECGHKFCYKCIFSWSIKEVKEPSCPLCKTSFDFITRQDVSLSGKLDETVVVVGKKATESSTRSQRSVVLDHVCNQCGNSDSESLLMRCGTCGNRAIHQFCMDPPSPPPWFCPGCTHGHQRDSMRLAWSHFLPGPSTQEMRPVIRPSNVRRRSAHSYTLQRSSRLISTSYRPSLHTELTQSMGPVRRRNVAGQQSLRSWLNNDTHRDS